MNLIFLFLFLFSCAFTLLPSCCSVVSAAGLETSRSCYCVTADDSEDFNSHFCSGLSTHNLSYFANTGAFNNSYSTFYFAPGNHFLYRGVNVHQHATYVTHLSLIGVTSDSSPTDSPCNNSTTPAAIVQCEGRDAGFYFANVTNLAIFGLEFHNCGYTVSVSLHRHSAALTLVSVWNLTMCSVKILYSNGWGLLGEPVNGVSLINNTVFDGSHSITTHSGSYGGGNVFLSYNDNSCLNTLLTIAHTTITNGSNKPTLNSNNAYGSGLHIYIRTTNGIKTHVDSVYYSGNAGGHGGNVAVFYVTDDSVWPSTVTFINCSFLSGIADMGGGVYIMLIANNAFNLSQLSNNYPVVSISKSVIAHNTATKVGAGVYVQLHESPYQLSVATVEFGETIFDNNVNQNSSDSLSRGGAAFNLINFNDPGYISDRNPQYRIVFFSCNFSRNRGKASLNDTVGSGTLYVEESALTILKDCLFEDNKCTGITAVHSNILLEGNITLRNNAAFNGGGIIMCSNSVLYLYLSKYVYVLIENCHAENSGGGIYAEFECSQAIPPCFFQTSNSTDISKPHFYLHNNTAARAGSAVSGGAVDSCYAFGPYTKDNKSSIFNDLFKIVPVSENDKSVVSSNPTSACFCTNGSPACNDTQKQYKEQVYPGGTLSLPVVVVGQRDGTVPGLVVANSLDHNVHIEGQSDRLIDTKSCTTIHFTLLTSNSIKLPHSVRLDPSTLLLFPLQAPQRTPVLWCAH